MFPGRQTLDVRGARKDTDNFSWRLVAQVDPSDDIMAYGSVARGYKGPAYDQQPVSDAPVFVEPEIPTGYELGLRTVLFQRTTVLSLTGFFTEFRNFQAQAFDQNVFPSRAGLLTVRYPLRSGMAVGVAYPHSTAGLPQSEVTPAPSGLSPPPPAPAGGGQAASTSR